MWFLGEIDLVIGEWYSLQWYIQGLPVDAQQEVRVAGVHVCQILVLIVVRFTPVFRSVSHFLFRLFAICCNNAAHCGIASVTAATGGGYPHFHRCVQATRTKSSVT